VPYILLESVPVLTFTNYIVCLRMPPKYHLNIKPKRL